MDNIERTLQEMKNHGAQIVVVLLENRSDYGMVKLASDTVGILTQCMDWAKIASGSPKGYFDNVSLKMNAKLGGISHTLEQRFAGGPSGQYQSPPNSLMWSFEKPCMVVGIDVSHPEPGSERESIAAVVGSVNRAATEYAACMAAQASREEGVQELTTLMVELFGAFKQRNGGNMPQHVIVYRDGVSAGQFNEIRASEIPQIKDAVDLCGCLDGVKITFLICSKGHNSRFAYRDSSGVLINGCPGLYINELSGLTSPSINEFYIQHHMALQGTAKCARYSVLFDEIGMTNEQLAVLTNSLCYLFGRCNMAVSKVTPVMYAHLAAFRARKLLRAGATPADLRKISNNWSQVQPKGMSFGMFFL